MSKRRTREQKEKALHTFTISWSPEASEPKKGISEANVKGQFTSPTISDSIKKSDKKSAKNMEKSGDLASVKIDLIRSLNLAALILASELVIYFIWNK